MKWTVAFVAGGFWLLVAVPMWWFFAAFGAPLPPRPTDELDGWEVFFMASFYLPLLALLGVGLFALRDRQRNQR